jgi:hypothetical protein
MTRSSARNSSSGGVATSGSPFSGVSVPWLLFTCSLQVAEAVSQRRIFLKPERAPCMAFLIERPRPDRASACVREYELFQRSNAMPPATPASPASPAAPTAGTLLAFLAAVPTRLALLATARTRPFIALLLTSPRKWATPGIRLAGFLGDLLGALLLLERFAFADFAPLLRRELVRAPALVEPTLRVLPPERLFPARFVLVWAMSLPS